MLDAGAVQKLLKEGKSLLPIGVTDVGGDFGRGDVITCVDATGKAIARGMSNYASAEVKRIMRKPSSEIAAILGYVEAPGPDDAEESMLDLLSKERIVAGPGFKRWLIAPAALGIHLCIGSVYAWSLFNPALVKRIGVVTSAADDWTLKQVVWVFTVAIVFLGLSAALAGKWLEKVGPRMVGVVATACWAGGFVIGGAGIVTGQLWLLYLGYGVVGGCGLGLGYVSPVSTLIRWFPDRRGMATGIAIMGFGGGAMLAQPMIDGLVRFHYEAPTYVGATADVELVTDGGRRYIAQDQARREVVVVGPNDVAAMIEPDF